MCRYILLEFLHWCSFFNGCNDEVSDLIVTTKVCHSEVQVNHECHCVHLIGYVEEFQVTNSFMPHLDKLINEDDELWETADIQKYSNLACIGQETLADEWENSKHDIEKNEAVEEPCGICELIVDDISDTIHLINHVFVGNVLMQLAGSPLHQDSNIKIGNCIVREHI